MYTMSIQKQKTTFIVVDTNTVCNKKVNVNFSCQSYVCCDQCIVDAKSIAAIKRS
jgi:hypothetical protein